MRGKLSLPASTIAASGAMGPLGLGWTLLHRILYWILPGMVPVLKTTLPTRNEGNSLSRAWRPLIWLRGCVNAMRLPSDGLSMLLYRDLARLTRDSIISLYASNPEEMRLMVEMINRVFANHRGYFVHVLAFEINLSCPNVDGPIDRLGILKEASNLPLPVIAKIGAETEQVDVVVKAAKKEYIDAVSAINSVLWERIFGNRRSPLEKLTGQRGGVSGRPIKPLAIAILEELRSRLPEGFPIYAGGGIQTYRDVRDFVDAGATGIVLGTVLTQYLLLAIILLLTIRKKGIKTPG